MSLLIGACSLGKITADRASVHLSRRRALAERGAYAGCRHMTADSARGVPSEATRDRRREFGQCGHPPTGWRRRAPILKNEGISHYLIENKKSQNSVLGYPIMLLKTNKIAFSQLCY